MPDWNAERHALGIEAMDATHREFVALLDALARADDAGFAPLFGCLVEHCRRHFAEEGRLMRQCRFAALGEHEGEHFRLLGELLQFQRAIQRGRPALARGYVRDGLMHWFETHLATMDAALALRLARTERSA
jgi:hemerythrin-like metal-binding protein